MTGRIGISLGDVTGIGPEVTLKALAAEAAQNEFRYLLIGDWGWISRLNEEIGTNLPLQQLTENNQNERYLVFNPLAESLPVELMHGSPAAAHAALAWLKEAAKRCLHFELDAMVTAPLNKEAILRTGQPFIGQTELLSELAGTTRTAMMLLGHDEKERWLRVVLATTHVPISLVSVQLSQEKIELAIELAAESCRLLKLSQSRIGVCGLNPHAGEGGKMGDEEQRVITPAIENMAKRGIVSRGPLSADSLFYYAFHGHFDAVVAMYHDQGLVPLKMIGFDSGVNWTLGLPFIRTSPDHGTAYDIAGKNKANPSSMVAALRLAQNLAAQA